MDRPKRDPKRHFSKKFGEYTGGFEIIAEQVGDLDRIPVAGGSDLNHDGINDIVIGAADNNEGGSNSGAVYIVWGGGHSAVDLGLISQSIGGAKIVGAAGSLTGASVSITGDLNGDGTADLMIGAPGVGESGYAFFTPATWLPDTNVYGTNGDDIMGPGYGSTHLIGNGTDNIIALAGNDVIDAAGGDDIIDGGTGADSMTGGTGDDTYYVDNAGDQAIELAGGGADTVFTTLLDYTLAGEVEKLTSSGAGDFTLTGNALGNTITGGAGKDVLTGLGGKDILVGGAGDDVLIGGALADTLTGGTGADNFVFDSLTTSANKDTIKDFELSIDHIELDRAAFGAFSSNAAGALTAADLFYGTAATAANQHLIYSSTTGALYYDADGLGGAAQVQIASLTNHALILRSDIVLI